MQEEVVAEKRLELYEAVYNLMSLVSGAQDPKWSVKQIQYGLQNVFPERSAEELEEALQKLIDMEIVEKVGKEEKPYYVIAVRDSDKINLRRVRDQLNDIENERQGVVVPANKGNGKIPNVYEAEQKLQGNLKDMKERVEARLKEMEKEAAKDAPKRVTLDNEKKTLSHVTWWQATKTVVQSIVKQRWVAAKYLMKNGYPITALLYDISVLYPDELYLAIKMEKYPMNEKVLEEFCALHYHRSKHHFQYWLTVRPGKRIVPREVPLKYVVEMVACLIATVEVAAKNRYSLQEWYRMCGTEMILHDKTRRLLEALISEHEEASA